jgi:hypothetical protein
MQQQAKQRELEAAAAASASAAAAEAPIVAPTLIGKKQVLFSNSGGRRGT